MRKSLLIFLVAIFATSIAFADNIDKLSAGTKLFLKIRAEEASNPSLRTAPPPTQFKVKPEVEMGYKTGFAPTEIVNNVEVIDAFIYLNDVNNLSTLEANGVTVMCKFDKFVTAKIPIDRIEAISQLDNVVQIDVSRLLQLKTDLASQATNADKAWDGLVNGLCEEYTGKGVLVGVIDQGIDFKHYAFNDANGTTRVKRVYAPGTSSTVYTSNFPNYDVSGGSHGTHTSTTAGGRAVTVNGTTYTGMAPESDLYLCGLSSLSSANIANSLSNINSYATQQGIPCVVNISLGSQYGAHDGTGSLASAYSSFTSNGTANGRILCVAAGNEAGGNIYFGGTATTTTPAATSLEYLIYSDVEGTYTYYYNSSYYSEYYVWPQEAGQQLKFQFVVIDKSTNSIVYTANAVTPTNTSSVSLGSTYFKYNNSNATVSISRSTDTYSGKYYYDIIVKGTSTESLSNTNSSGQYISRYAVGMLVYSTSGTVKFDCWGDGSFSEFLDSDYAGTYGNYTFTKGSDECSIGNEVPTSGIITVGAYVTRKTVTTSNNVSYTASDYTVGDIAPFSSYSTGCGPDGQVYPHITAPGAVLIAGVNRYDTSNYPASQSSSSEYMTIANYTDGSRYGSMSGTSMATPTTTGIMALWLQANPDLTVNDVLNVFSQTAIKDSYVTGTNASHFGRYGKIDALAGLKYIAPCDDDNPTITATPTTVAFGDQVAGGTYTQTFTVTGANLEGNITLTKSGSSAFTISPTSVTKATAEGNGATITVTFKPTANTTADYTGTVTLTSSNASSVTVSLTGKGVYTAPAITANPTSLSFTGNSGTTYTKTVTVTGTNLQGNITAAISSDANGFYSVSPTTITSSNGSASSTVTVTWAPTAGGTSTANLVLTTTGTGASSVTVPITGTAQGPTITANPTSVTFTGAYATRTYTQAVTVTGTNLTQNITASISGANVYSIDNTSLPTTGGTITVTYAPIAAGNTTATLTLSSTGASSVTVPITGTAQAATPTLVVSPASLTFSTDLENSQQQTFAVTGRFIDGAVNVALTDANGVFTVSPTSIPAASISETTPVNVTVTFQSATEGSYTGTITLTSDGAESKTVTLNATANDGGTASDAYLNIAKYATIDEAGATVSGMSSIYKYTEYADDACAWLTVSNYGAQQADANQNWLETKSLKGYSNTWSATDIFLGNGSYFTSGGYSIYGSGNQIFYVTNCTQVKSMIKDGNANATLAIYECTKGSDGTLTAATTATDTKTGNCSSSNPNVITSSTIDASKIYKVVLTGGGSYPDLLEIGFKTPLNPLGMPAITNVAPTTTTAEVTWTSGENNVGWNLRYRKYVEQENSTPFFESFENGLNEWTLVDTDGDGNNWRQFDPTNFSNSSYTAYDGQYVAMSRSWQNSTALTPDQWMISPQIEDLGGTLKYYIMDDGSYQEKYRIYVSTSGTDISSFQPVTEDMYSPASTTWTEVAIDLSQYAGKAGYIGFRHYDCSDEDFMLIDALGLYKGSEGEWIYVNNVTSPYTIDGLTPETTYEVQVQGIGDNGKTSSWTASTIFTTLGGISLAELELNGTVGTTYTVSDELVAVDYAIVDDAIYLWCKDQGNASIAPAPAVGDKIDYLGNDQYAQNGRAWDESNWVALKFSVGSVQTAVTSITSAKGHKINAGTITGVYSDATNYTIAMPEGEGLPTGAVGDEFTYTPNVYCVANFNPAYLTEDGAQLKDNGNVYFFMTPKVQEVCEITYAYWNAENFIVPTTSGFVGSLSLDWTYNEMGNVTSQLNADNIYRFKTIVQRTGATTSLPALKAEGGVYKVAPLNLTSTSKADIPTAIGTVKAGVDVVDVYYVNSTGLMSKTPFQGVNIIVTRYSDGSRTTVKKVFK